MPTYTYAHTNTFFGAVGPSRFSHDLLRWASSAAWAPPRPEGCIAGSVAPPDLRCAANDVRGGSYAPRSPCILELSFPWCFGSGGQRACRIRPMSQCRHLAIVARVDSLCAIRTMEAHTKHITSNCAWERTNMSIANEQMHRLGNRDFFSAC